MTMNFDIESTSIVTMVHRHACIEYPIIWSYFFQIQVLHRSLQNFHAWLEEMMREVDLSMNLTLQQML